MGRVGTVGQEQVPEPRAASSALERLDNGGQLVRASGSSQFAALLGTFSLPPSGYLALAVQALLIAAITAWASRRTLFATLDDID